MKLVLDTNILVSFFRENPVNKLISKSIFFNLELFIPEYVIEELKKNKDDILKYSELDLEGFNERLSELLKFIKVVPEKEFKEFRFKAKKIAPHDKDIPIFALALKLGCWIWSNELRFKDQSKIKVLSTRDMIEYFCD